MPDSSSLIFLREPDKKLWTAADKLRSNLAAAVYKHAILGQIFHGGTIGGIMVFGQDQWARGAHWRRAQRARRVRLRRKQPNQSNPTTWRLAAMNMAIRGTDFDFGKERADTFTRDQHPDLRADFVIANPPFNDSDWFGKDHDVRWQFGVPPNLEIEFPPSRKEDSVSQKCHELN